MKLKQSAIKELNGIIGRTAVISGQIRQFEMGTSAACNVFSALGKLQALQEHLEEMLGMVQRLAVILLEDK